jgi:malonate decarboxylase epsilon subunit
MSVAFLFPGQGSQSEGMIDRLPADPIVRTTIEEASTVLHRDVSKLDTEENLGKTEFAQILLFVCGLAMARLLEARGVHADFAAGHSVGAFAAATLAGVVDLKTALQFVSARGDAMASAFPTGYGMGAITGVPNSDVEVMLDEVRKQGEQLFIANWNAPDQTVVSGTNSAIRSLLELASNRGARRATTLNVIVPSHTELMLPVAEQLFRIAAQIAPKPPRMPYVSNSTARLLYDGASILDDLVWAVSRPVRWHEATVTMYEAGVRVFLEMPPGQVLTRLASSAFPDSRSLAIEEVGINSALAVAKNR